jgi:hypothetical protein
MRDPISPIRRSAVRLDPGPVYGRPGMAVAVVSPDGFPVGTDRLYEVIEGARRLMNESFTRRRIPTPPGGWQLVLLHPDEDWRDYLCAEVAAQVTAQLAEEPAGAAVAVVLAVAEELPR